MIVTINIALHTLLVSLQAPSDIKLINFDGYVNSSIVSQFNMEKGLYIYDLIYTIRDKNHIFTIHHLLTLYLIYMSEYYGLINHGFYIFTLTNYTTIFLGLAKVVRNLKRKDLILYTDLLFLILFGYLRIYKFTDCVYVNYSRGLISNYSYDLKSVYITVWALQIFWFNKLMNIFINQHLQEYKNHTIYCGKIVKMKMLRWLKYRKLL